MSNANGTEFTPQERAARLTFDLVNGGQMTPRQVAEDLGMYEAHVQYAAEC